jgi:hypothetical protein
VDITDEMLGLTRGNAFGSYSRFIEAISRQLSNEQKS